MVPLCCKCCTLISVCYTVKILYFKDVIYYILFRCDVRFCVVISVLLLPFSSKKNESYFRDTWVGCMVYVVNSDVMDLRVTTKINVNEQLGKMIKFDT